MDSNFNNSQVYPNVNIYSSKSEKYPDEIEFTFSTYLRLKFNDTWYLKKLITGMAIFNDKDEIAAATATQLEHFNRQVYIHLCCSAFDADSFTGEEKTYTVDDNQQEETERIFQFINRF